MLYRKTTETLLLSVVRCENGVHLESMSMSRDLQESTVRLSSAFNVDYDSHMRQLLAQLCARLQIGVVELLLDEFNLCRRLKYECGCISNNSYNTTRASAACCRDIICGAEAQAKRRRNSLTCASTLLAARRSSLFISSTCSRMGVDARDCRV